MAQPNIPTPSIKLTSFACPHCGAHATQTWFLTRVVRCQGDHPVPPVWSLDEIKELLADAAKSRNAETREKLEHAAQHFRRVALGEPFIAAESSDPYRPPGLNNVFVSLCYTCDKPAIWLHDRLLYPTGMTGPVPNGDLSPDVLRDYEEARSILDISPRGAAALLRLAVEKICTELGAEGDNINQRIAYLVGQGLPPLVQQALDAVRVIGNEAVHPGQLDLRDDRDTASKLFGLVNFIAEDRITRPKQIAGLFDMIPEGKRAGIDARNAKAIEKAKS